MKPTTSPKWFRVQFNASGKVHVVLPVEGSGNQSHLVVYVLAKDEDSAQTAAIRIHARLAMKLRRAEYDRQGRCRCGRSRNVPKQKRCSTCCVRASRDRRNSRRREKGEAVAPPSKRVAFQELQEEQREAVRVETRLAVLREVLGWWLSSRNSKGFTDRVRAEIAKLAGEKAA